MSTIWQLPCLPYELALEHAWSAGTISPPIRVFIDMVLAVCKQYTVAIPCRASGTCTPTSPTRCVTSSQRACNARWERALNQRAALGPYSRATVLDALLTERAEKIVSQTSPKVSVDERELALSAGKPGSDLQELCGPWRTLLQHKGPGQRTGVAAGEAAGLVGFARGKNSGRPGEPSSSTPAR